jgi:hypothetical protein
VMDCMQTVLRNAVQIQKAKIDIGEHCSNAVPAGPDARSVNTSMMGTYSAGLLVSVRVLLLQGLCT